MVFEKFNSHRSFFVQFQKKSFAYTKQLKIEMQNTRYKSTNASAKKLATLILRYFNVNFCTQAIPLTVSKVFKLKLKIIKTREKTR